MPQGASIFAAPGSPQTSAPRRPGDAQGLAWRAVDFARLLASPGGSSLLIKDMASARESLAADRSTGEPRSADPAPSSFESCTAVGEAALSEVRRLLTAWRTHEPGARLGVDPEELHQL